MHRFDARWKAAAPCLLIACLLVPAALVAGCSDWEPAVQGTGSVAVTSLPPGAEIYFDQEYRGTTPATITKAPAGDHTLELRKDGYERSARNVTVVNGGTTTIDSVLTKSAATLPVTVKTTATPAGKPGAPQIHVDGYWTLPAGGSMANPVSLLLHTEAFNVGTIDAREVTVHAFFSYEGREICWDEVELGTLNAGGHVVTDTMVSCMLPSGFTAPALVVRYESLEVTP